MESSEVRARSIITIVAVFGVGAVLGAGVTWLIISASGRGRGRSLRRSTASPVAMSEDGSGSGSGSGSGWTKRSRQRCSDQLRRILADHEVRLMEAVDKFVAHFSVTTHDHDQTSKSSRQLSQPEVARSNPQLEDFTPAQRQHISDENVNNSSASVTRRLFSQVDRLFEGSAKDRERALELLKAKEHQLSHDVNFVWRLAKATHFKSKIESERDKNEEKRLAYLSRDLAARSLTIDPNSAAAHKWFAITTGVVGDYESPRVRIQTGVIFKEHVEKAITLNPKDPTNYYLLGRWCYGLYALSWVEKKLVSTFYATLPTATVDDALKHFLKAEKMNPGMFKENLLFIGKCYIEKKDFTTAVKWLQQAAKVPVNGVDDENCQKEVYSLLAKYTRHTDVTT